VEFLHNFSLSNFDATRRRKIEYDLKSLAIVKLGISAALFLINPFLGIWVGTASLMLGGLAGGIHLSGVIFQPNIRRVNNTGLRIKVFRSARIHNRARAYRSASRSSFAHASGGDDSGGDSESDSGDPPEHGISFPVTPFEYFYRKTDNSLLPWHVLYASDCWYLTCCKYPVEVVSV
jgi:hypothetical protein